MSDTCFGIDLGQMNDYTAIIAMKGDYETRQVIFCDRYRREPYAVMMSKCAKVIHTAGNGVILGDATGGASSGIFDMLTPLIKNRLLRIKITGAGVPHYQNGFFMLPKVAIVNKLIIDFQGNHIRIPKQLNHSKTISDELLSYEHDMSKAGNIQFNARDGEHDDLVIALALANWGFNYRELPGLAGFKSKYHK